MVKMDDHGLIYTFRGIVGESLSAQRAYEIGRIAAESLGENQELYMAGDHRKSTPLLKSAVCAGLLAGGINVFDCGMLPTPLMSRTAARMNRYGLMVTASHNPPEWNGFQFLEKDSHIFGPDWEVNVKSQFGNPPEELPFPRLGDYGHYLSALDDYTEELLEEVDISKSFNILADFSHGTAALVVPKLLEAFGIEYTAMHLGINPVFLDDLFHRIAQASQKTLQDVCDFVKTNKLDLGIVYDGDADRLMVIDDRGRYVNGDHLMIIMSRNCFPEGGTVIVTADTSVTVNQYLEPLGFDVVPSRVGQSFLGSLAREKKAVFAGEPTGHYMFPNYSLHGDGIRGIFVLLQALQYEGAPLSEIVDDFPPTVINRIQLKADVDLAQLSDQVAEYLTRRFGSYKQIHKRLFVGEKDGVKAVFRQSPFDATIRLFTESLEAEESGMLLEEMKKVIVS